MFHKRVQSHGLILLFAISLYVGSRGSNLETNHISDATQSNAQMSDISGNSVSLQGSNFDGTLDLREVLNTSEDYWVYYQTYSNKYEMYINETNMTIFTTCIRHHKLELTEDEYNFTLYESLNGIKAEENCTGKFINFTLTAGTNKPPKAMQVYPGSEKRPEYMATLEYTDPDSHNCNVYSISYLVTDLANDTGTCEMHIKDSYVHRGPTNSCLTYYNTNCKGKKYQPYIPECNNTDQRDRNSL
uniref:Putative group v salivary lipocalin n=1 Tax=Rhipicephalus pulchellus TaxID=72859 RepID=L7LT69_RHIPC